MPKESKLQSSFNAGQISSSVLGRVDNPRYESGLLKTQNYIPIVQGPLIRRPGTLFVANYKDPSKPPVLIPFQFSINQNYMIEAGDKYMRFYQNEAQIVTNTTAFLVTGNYMIPGQSDLTGGALVLSGLRFQALRSSASAGVGERIFSTSTVSSGTTLELQSPYAWADLAKIRFTQKQDTLYLTHPNYPPTKLIRTGINTWDLKQIIFQDGPYLPLNSYASVGDATNIILNSVYTNAFNNASNAIQINTLPSFTISGGVGSSANVYVTASGHTFRNGDQVFVSGVTNSAGNPINNVTAAANPFFSYQTNSSANQASWTVANAGSANHFDLVGANIGGFSYTSGGTVQPALFQLITGSSGTFWADTQISSTSTTSNYWPMYRSIALVENGVRFWGHIVGVQNAANAIVALGPNQFLPGLPSLAAGSSQFWQMGVFNLINGFPAACTMHQDRLTFAGCPSFPQEIDASMTGSYEVFSSSGSNYQVANNNALQFNLNSQDLNAVRWLKSSNQGLVAGGANAEWSISPSTQTPALSPTNINAMQTTSFGSADVDALTVANSIIYVQRAQRKVRELLYFWQVQSFRSTNLTELAEGITLPSITKIVNQKENHPIVWGIRSDGQLLSMSYKRDDVTLQTEVGWAYHNLGGRSDSAFSPPLVGSMAVIPSGDTTFDELWITTQRYINGTTVGTIEVMSKPFDDITPQERSYHFDCGAIYNSSILVTGITNASSCVVTAPNHGLSNSSQVRFYNTVGMNLTTTDVDGNIVTSSVVNETLFQVASTTTNTFYLQDFYGNFVNTNSTSAYVGSAVINQLVSSISGFNWLIGETVSVLADGGICANTVISSTGVLTLQYPAAIVSVGYQYNSDGQLLRSHDGSAQGTAIGSTRRVNRAAFMLHNVGDFNIGPDFSRLTPCEFATADYNSAGVAAPLFTGIHRDGVESGGSAFSDTICFRQNSGLPGMVQACVRFLEENDV